VALTFFRSLGHAIAFKQKAGFEDFLKISETYVTNLGALAGHDDNQSLACQQLEGFSNRSRTVFQFSAKLLFAEGFPHLKLKRYDRMLYVFVCFLPE